MIGSAFTLSLPPIAGGATVGKFSGSSKRPSLAAATGAGRVFLHDPYREGDEAEISYLNINRGEIVGLEALNTGAADVLCIGTSTNLLAYDVVRNRDHFFLEIESGLVLSGL